MSSAVQISIAGRAYEIACDPGQEAMLSALAQDVDRRARELLKAVGPVSDTKLLVMVALTLADDMREGKGPAAGVAVDGGGDERIAAGIDKLAGRIESIADRLRSA